MTSAILNVDAAIIADVAPVLSAAGITITGSVDSPPGTGRLLLVIEGDAIPAQCQGMNVNAEIRHDADGTETLSRIELA